MMKKLQSSLILILLLSLMLSLVACQGGESSQNNQTSEKNENSESQTQESEKATEPEKAAETEAEKLVIGDSADTLNKAEREKGYEIFYPLGAKFLLPKTYKDSKSVKRRHNGFDMKAEDLIYFSRAYYFRPEAAFKAYDEIRQLPAGEERDKRMAEEVRGQERPLVGFFVLNKANMPKDEAALVEQLGFDKFEKIGETDKLIQYFANGEAKLDQLSDKDKTEYEALLADIDQVRRSVSAFSPDKPESSMLKCEPWGDLEAQTLDGGKLNKDYFKQAKLTYAIYMATWCPDCRATLEQLAPVQDQAKAKGFQFLTVVQDLMMENDDHEKVLEAAKKEFEECQIKADSFTAVYDSWKLEDRFFIRLMNYPTIVIFDENGKIVKCYVGPEDVTPESLMQELDEAAAEFMPQAAAVIPTPQPGEPASESPAPIETQAPEPTTGETIDLGNGMIHWITVSEAESMAAETLPMASDCNCGR